MPILIVAFAAAISQVERPTPVGPGRADFGARSPAESPEKRHDLGLIRDASLMEIIPSPVSESGPGEYNRTDAED